LKRNWSIRKERYWKESRSLFEGLRKMFGRGSEFLEQVIQRKLNSQLEKLVMKKKERRVSRNKRVKDNPRPTRGSALVRTSLLSFSLIAAAHNLSL